MDRTNDPDHPFSLLPPADAVPPIRQVRSAPPSPAFGGPEGVEQFSSHSAPVSPNFGLSYPRTYGANGFYSQQLLVSQPPPPYPIFGQSYLRPRTQGMVVTHDILDMSDYPMVIVCPFCRATVVTELHYKAGFMTFYLSCLLCLGIVTAFGCCLVPFCLDGSKDVVHRCPNCRCRIVKFVRLK